ncbi:hypothetical protein ABW365_18695 [Enterococcus avium]
MGKNNYTSISEDEFISVTKVFNLKKKSERYFRQSLGLNSEGEIDFDNKLKIRYIFLAIWMRGIGISELNKNPLFFQSEKIALAISELLKNRLSKKSLLYLQYSIFLSLTRRDTLMIEAETIAFLKTGIIFNSINTCFLQQNVEMDDQNLAFISFVYKNLPYNPESYRLIEVDYQYYRTRLIKSHPSVVQLIRNFEAGFEMNLLGKWNLKNP